LISLEILTISACSGVLLWFFSRTSAGIAQSGFSLTNRNQSGMEKGDESAGIESDEKAAFTGKQATQNASRPAAKNDFLNFRSKR